MIINNYADSAEHDPECSSTEEMRAAIEDFNDLDDEQKKECVLVSMDVKALYPSMKWSEILSAVKEMILASPMMIDNVDWVAVARYIAVMIPEEEIEQEGVRLVIPKRKKIHTRRITVDYLRNKKNKESWTIARKPGPRHKKKMHSR